MCPVCRSALLHTCFCADSHMCSHLQGLTRALCADQRCGCPCPGTTQSSWCRRRPSGASSSATAATSSTTPLMAGAALAAACNSRMPAASCPPQGSSVLCICASKAACTLQAFSYNHLQTMLHGVTAHACGAPRILCCLMLVLHASRFRGCLVDEHYYPTLFAMHNRQLETDCKGVLTVAEFRCQPACDACRSIMSVAAFLL